MKIAKTDPDALNQKVNGKTPLIMCIENIMRYTEPVVNNKNRSSDEQNKHQTPLDQLKLIDAFLALHGKPALEPRFPINI